MGNGMKNNQWHNVSVMVTLYLSYFSFLSMEELLTQTSRIKIYRTNTIFININGSKQCPVQFAYNRLGKKKTLAIASC